MLRINEKLEIRHYKGERFGSPASFIRGWVLGFSLYQKERVQLGLKKSRTENLDFCMAGAAEPLLKKLYYENCPGCKVDQINENSRGIPIKEFLFIWIVVLCNGK